jgi:hypothetical protein
MILIESPRQFLGSWCCRLGFTIPYTIKGHKQRHRSEFLAVVDDGHGPRDTLELIIEVMGEKMTRWPRS